MKTKKAIMTILTLALSVGVTACSSGGSEVNNSPKASDNKKSAEPTTIKALAILSGGEPPVLENSQALKEIEKKANVKLSVEFIPGDVYPDKVNIAIASGSQYDLILLTDGKDSKYEKLAKQGAFHNLTSIVKENKNLLKIPQYSWDNTSVKGELYGVPRPRPLLAGGNANIFIRKDWLDKYNLPVPKTVDEFTNALKVFKEKDPAGGGKTIPLVAGPYTSPTFGSMNPIAFAMGVPFSYKVDGDKASIFYQDPAYKKFLDWIRMATENGLIDKDAPVQKGGAALDKFISGTAGAFVNNVSVLNETTMTKMRKTDPKAELVGIPYLVGPEGHKGVQKIEGYFGIWVVPSNVSKEKVNKIVEFLDWSASEEATSIGKAGVQGIHYNSYNKDLGVAERTEEQKKLYDKERPALLVLQNEYTKYSYVDSQIPEIRKAQQAVIDAFDNVGVENPFIAFLSETAGKNPDHAKKITDATVKYVLGQGKWEAVQSEIDTWSNGVGAQILKEYMDQYKESKKK
ncbi:Lipoprotein LipO precursor [compost metagenome]